MTSLWYYNQPPDLHVRFNGTQVGLHREVVSANPYFKELLDCKDSKEIIDIPRDPLGAMIYLNSLYQSHINQSISIDYTTKMIEAGNYFCDDSVRFVTGEMYSYLSDDQCVQVLNSISDLTHIKKYQQMFYCVTSVRHVDPGLHPSETDDSIYTHEFFTGPCKGLSSAAFSNIIRCNPSEPLVLLGLLLTSPKNFSDLVRRMDCRAIFDSRRHILEEIIRLIPSCLEPEYFHQFNLAQEDLHPKVLIIPGDQPFDSKDITYDHLDSVIYYQGTPDWICRVNSPQGKYYLSCPVLLAMRSKIAQNWQQYISIESVPPDPFYIRLEVWRYKNSEGKPFEFSKIDCKARIVNL